MECPTGTVKPSVAAQPQGPSWAGPLREIASRTARPILSVRSLLAPLPPQQQAHFCTFAVQDALRRLPTGMVCHGSKLAVEEIKPGSRLARPPKDVLHRLPALAAPAPNLSSGFLRPPASCWVSASPVLLRAALSPCLLPSLSPFVLGHAHRPGRQGRAGHGSLATLLLAKPMPGPDGRTHDRLTSCYLNTCHGLVAWNPGDVLYS